MIYLKKWALIQRFNQEIKKGNLENLMSLTFPDAGPPIFEEIKNKIMELLNSEIQLTEDDKSRLEISKDLDEIANDVSRRSVLKNEFVEKINKVIIEKLRAENSVLKNEIRSKEEGEKKEKRDLQGKIQRLQQNAQAKLERRTGDFKKKLAIKQKGFKTTLEKNREDFKKDLEEKEEAYNKLSMERDGWYAEQLASIEKIQLQNEELQDLRKQNQKIDILEKKIAKLDSWYSKETSKLKKEVDVLIEYSLKPFVSN